MERFSCCQEIEEFELFDPRFKFDITWSCRARSGIYKRRERIPDQGGMIEEQSSRCAVI